MVKYDETAYISEPEDPDVEPPDLEDWSQLTYLGSPWPTTEIVEALGPESANKLQHRYTWPKYGYIIYYRRPEATGIASVLMNPSLWAAALGGRFRDTTKTSFLRICQRHSAAR